MLLLGIDVGTSSIKVSVVDSTSRQALVSVQYPETEVEIISLSTGWAEQSPELWWEHVQLAIKKSHSSGSYHPGDIKAIGISYQMHGLVLVNKEQKVLRNSIIWCDSRAVPYGDKALMKIGADVCNSCLLNSPGNFTASKLAWVKENEPDIYEQIDKILLPGDFISMKLTGHCSTTISALSEGIFWDFKKNELSADIFRHFDFRYSIIPDIQPVFSIHGKLKKEVAEDLLLNNEVVVAYKAGDQPNNALSLNILKPGEVAANAGTSGVIYCVSDKLTFDSESRVNSFAHVNYNPMLPRIGVLLCINGTGIMNRWVRNSVMPARTYNELNKQAMSIPAGSEGLLIFPFGNGVERVLKNKLTGAHISRIDLNLHTPMHIYRAAQEGIAFSFRYGLDILKESGLTPGIIRAGKTNMFLSDLFTESFVNVTGIPLELYQMEGSTGAALAAGAGAGIFSNAEEALGGIKQVDKVMPDKASFYNELYEVWKKELDKILLNDFEL